MLALFIVLLFFIGTVHIFGCWAGTPEGTLIGVVVYVVYCMSIIGLLLESTCIEGWL